jgi:pimeloyl-ACP methyl ester carboxylesterase
MVLVGHSMGGLISHLQTVDSGDAFWKLVSDKPFESLQLHEKTREELRRVFFFERSPSVERVIFIGTPHHGSKLSPALPGRLAAYFVRLPKTLGTAARDLAASPDLPMALRAGRIPTSIELLAPDSPALRTLAERPRPESVRYHSVVGIAPSSSAVVERWLTGYDSGDSDGVVPVSSARLGDVESERFVPADHYHVHHHPFTVSEVRRILLEHLQPSAEKVANR